MDTVRIYTPVPRATAWTAATFAPVSPRSAAHMIALLDNAKPRADDMLAALSRRLQRNGESTHGWRKFTPSIPIADDMLRAVVADADLCITGLAD